MREIMTLSVPELKIGRELPKQKTLTVVIILSNNTKSARKLW
jgi:hypothetical protein